jgi:hypothetical protein
MAQRPHLRARSLRRIVSVLALTCGLGLLSQAQAHAAEGPAVVSAPTGVEYGGEAVIRVETAPGIRVRAGLSMIVSPGHILEGKPVEIRGTLLPAVPGRRVTLQERSRGRWVSSPAGLAGAGGDESVLVGMSCGMRN